MSMPLPGTFRTVRIDVNGIMINCAVAGDGPPLLMVHGYPQTHLMWHHLAPTLAEQFTVVLADLRGYGDSAKPEPTATSDNYAKRAMAADQVGLMATLGFDRFALVGHDRGARVSHRLALDFPTVVTRLALLDIVPTRHVFRNVDRVTAASYFFWFFLSAGGGVPETMIGADPDYWLNSTMLRMSDGHDFAPGVRAEYLRCFSDPATISASCADYRAAATIDLEHDDATAAAAEKITCPTLVLWGERGLLGRHYDVLDVWREYASDVRGTALPSGHFIAEEAPDETLAALRGFLT